ncbi:MAG TPA: serine/threonine-protein kinase, partial [Polyangia bacterium]
MIGRTIGNYVVREKIGEGGMGVVYRAEHPHIKRHVAIKVLHPGADRNPEVVHRFFNEARAATEIRNAHIVEVMDFGELPEGTPYLVMEWLEGESLGSLLRATRKLPVPRAAHILSGIARALKAAHSKGVVHRDLKPDNVFLVRVEGEPDLIKVLDFGIAKLLVTGMPARYQTQTGAIIGTPAYMSPEQCRGAKEIDHRSDVYSLGVMGYQMLTGRLPFESEALGELLLKHMTEKPPPPSAIEPAVPEGISSVIAAALEKEPEKRPTVDQVVSVMEGGSSSAPFFTTGRAAGGTVPMPTSDLGVGEAVAGVPSRAPRAEAGPHTTLGASAFELGLGGAGGASARRRVGAIALGVGIVAAAAVALFVV